MAIPVLFMIQHLHQGGTEDHFHDLVTGLDRARFEPHVIHFNDRDGDVARRLAADHDLRRTFIPVSKAYNPSGLAAALAVRRYLRRHAIRAVVTYHFVSDFIGTLAACGPGLPPVVSSRRDTGFTRTSRQLRLAPLLDRGIRRYIAVSAAVRQALIDNERIAPDKIEVIHNGIDADALRAVPANPAAERAQLGLAAEDLVIGCVANLRPVKNHLLLLEAFAHLRARHPGRSLRLLLAGDGPLRSEIEDKVRSLELGPAVIMTGFSHEVTREFRASDIIVLASETEGLSNSLIQAMAFEKPVVACRVGGNPEVVTDGETGLLVEARQPALFANAMERLVADPELRCRMGQAGARRVRERFSRRAMIARHEQLILRLIENP